MRVGFFFCVLISALCFTSCDLRYVATNTYNRYIIDAPYDVIIVPGTPYDTAQPSGLFKARMYWAKQLYDRGIARNIIFSGAAVHTPYVESVAMKIYASALGIPATHTFVEIRATTSKENVFYGWKLARQLGFKKIALATDPFQSIFYSFLSNIYPRDLAHLPLSMDSIRKFATQLPDIQIDAQSAFIPDFTPPEKHRHTRSSLRNSFIQMQQ